MSETVILTGITGQTASFLAELLLEKGYKVYGFRRRSSVFNTERIDHILNDIHINDRLELVYGDLADYASIVNLVQEVKPDIFINCGAMSHVRVSFEVPEYTMDVTGTSVIRCLEAIRKYSPKTRFATMSSSEMFGSAPPPQNEKTSFQPQSPYAIAKIAGYYATVNYRNAYNLFASNCISFNCESSRRGETFVTRKITRAATRIKLGLQEHLYLGNLDAKRDWGHAKDYAKAIYMIVTAKNPDDFCIATGQTYSVKEFLESVFQKLDLDYEKYVKFDTRYLRPTEVDVLQGDYSKIKYSLGWEPEFTLEDIIDEMIECDLRLAREEKLIAENR